ncbi:hypothetical protein EJB05_48248, partial [Eragrostis curvula]
VVAPFLAFPLPHTAPPLLPAFGAHPATASLHQSTSRGHPSNRLNSLWLSTKQRIHNHIELRIIEEILRQHRRRATPASPRNLSRTPRPPERGVFPAVCRSTRAPQR